MKQTAIQELIDWAVSLQYNQQQCTDWIVIKNKAESLLEMEKQQIMDAAIVSHFEGVRQSAKTSKEYLEYGEQYYNETFKSE